MSVTMLNVFIVPDGSEDEFFANWSETTSVFSKNMGLVETHLHRNTGEGGGGPMFKFINIATWESPEAFRDAHIAYKPAEERMAGVKFHPAIYRSVIDVVNKPTSWPSPANLPNGGMMPQAGDMHADVDGDPRAPFASRRDDAPAYWSLGILWIMHATSATTGGAYSLIEQLCPRGSGPAPHIHLTSTETMYILNGEVTFLAGEKQTTLSAGGLISLPPGTVHAFRVDSPTALMLNSYTPPSWEEAIIASSEPALTRTLPPPDRPQPASDGPPDFLKFGMKVVDMPDPLRP